MPVDRAVCRHHLAPRIGVRLSVVYPGPTARAHRDRAGKYLQPSALADDLVIFRHVRSVRRGHLRFRKGVFPYARQRLHARSLRLEGMPIQQRAFGYKLVFLAGERYSVINFRRAARAHDDGTGRYLQHSAVGERELIISRRVPSVRARHRKSQLVFALPRVRAAGTGKQGKRMPLGQRRLGIERILRTRERRAVVRLFRARNADVYGSFQHFQIADFQIDRVIVRHVRARFIDDLQLRLVGDFPDFGQRTSKSRLQSISAGKPALDFVGFRGEGSAVVNVLRGRHLHRDRARGKGDFAGRRADRVAFCHVFPLRVVNRDRRRHGRNRGRFLRRVGIFKRRTLDPVPFGHRRGDGEGVAVNRRSGIYLDFYRFGEDGKNIFLRIARRAERARGHPPHLVFPYPARKLLRPFVGIRRRVLVGHALKERLCRIAGHFAVIDAFGARRTIVNDSAHAEKDRRQRGRQRRRGDNERAETPKNSFDIRNFQYLAPILFV